MKRAPLTARSILKIASLEEKKRKLAEQANSARRLMETCSTVDQLAEAAKRIARLEVTPLERETIAKAVCKKHQHITGLKLSIASARKMTSMESFSPTDVPDWLQNFVYVSRDKMFFNFETLEELDREAFNSEFGRSMMTPKDYSDGRSAPKQSASSAALNIWKIPTVYRRMYMPHEERFFTYDGQSCVNFYSPAGLPKLPTKLSRAEARAIEIVLAHFEHLFAAEPDRKLLLDWIAHVVQTKKRVSWMPILQGTEGDGKTFIAHVLETVLGRRNVAIVSGDTLEERYNHFMEGAILVFFEEVRLQGARRYEALNRMKPWITNETITIRAMHRGSYAIANTAAMIAATNHKDAIPAGENDTRYFPLFSRWQTKESIVAFNKENPTYYEKLYATLKYAGALRKWFLEYKVSTDFRPHGRAPESTHRAEMVALNRTDLDEAFQEVLEETDRRDFCATLLDSSLLDEMLEEKGETAPLGRARNKFLAEKGFSKFHKKININGKSTNYWTMEPARFIVDGAIQRDRVLAWLEGEALETHMKTS